MSCACMHQRFYSLAELPTEWEARPHTLGGYRVNTGVCGALKSVFSCAHNDVFIIWSDLLPLLGFCVAAGVHCCTEHFRTLPPSAQLVELGVFAGLIILRTWFVCNLIHHVSARSAAAVLRS